MVIADDLPSEELESREPTVEDCAELVPRVEPALRKICGRRRIRNSRR